MLVASSQRGFGASQLRSTIFLERRFRAHVMWRDRLVFDSRFAPAARRATPFAHLYAVWRGALQVAGGPVVEGPRAFALAEAEFDRVVPGALTFRSWGSPAVIVELRVPAAALRCPVGLRHGEVALPPAAWAAYGALAEAAAGPAPAPALHALMVALGAAGVVAADLVASVVAHEPERFARLWDVIRPLYASYATSTSVKELAGPSGLSLRQLGRDLTEMTRTFGLFGAGFRDAARVVRLRAAVLLLSAPDATAGEVARAVGYGSLDAMGRAFRDAGLPAPSAVQDAVRFAG